MGSVLWLFDSCGFIFGPAMFAAAGVALFLCARSTFGVPTKRTEQLLLPMSALPLLLGCCGFVVGVAVCWIENMPSFPWLVLGKVCLAGGVMSLLPLAWSLYLRRVRLARG